MLLSDAKLVPFGHRSNPSSLPLRWKGMKKDFIAGVNSEIDFVCHPFSVWALTFASIQRSIGLRTRLVGRQGHLLVNVPSQSYNQMNVKAARVKNYRPGLQSQRKFINPKEKINQSDLKLDGHQITSSNNNPFPGKDPAWVENVNVTKTPSNQGLLIGFMHTWVLHFLRLSSKFN